MSWNPMPAQQQRGAQLHNSGAAPAEAVKDRAAQKHDEADQQVAGEPARGINYPAEPIEERRGDTAPTLSDDAAQSWDDVVQPEDHSRQVQPQAGAGADQPLPEGK